MRAHLDAAGPQLAAPLLARPETGEPYFFNQAISCRPVSEFPNTDAVVLFYESQENYGGRLVAFLDGHHIWATSDQWRQLRDAGGPDRFLICRRRENCQAP
ncbi:MAG TPA: hypothetical protein VFW73_08910 [Lacipirellulaceae bacterium]|nr:hypothetical protein [Lacipirellulaceae bacterium]